MVKLLPLLLCVFLYGSARRARADVTIGVDSRAARFSPATWSGNQGREGSVSRTTWNNGAWCAFYWSSFSDKPKATLQITNQTRGSFVSYFVDGTLVDAVEVPQRGGIEIKQIVGAGPHTLVVYTRNSPQDDRWQGRNAYTVTGLTVEDGATPGGAPQTRRPWVLMVGDSITEGIQADDGKDSNLSDYSFLVGQGLNAAGYDYAVSACGYSGWIRPGDAHADVPAYFYIDDTGYQPALSRWNRIDEQTSLLDTRGHLSGDGSVGDEPAAIVLNYMVNETLSGAYAATAQASVTGALIVLRQAAPNALLLVVVPPGLESKQIYPHAARYLTALSNGVAAYQVTHRTDKRVVLLDLGPDVANALASPAYGGGVHPHAAGHAFVAAQLLPGLLAQLGVRPAAKAEP